MHRERFKPWLHIVAGYMKHSEMRDPSAADDGPRDVWAGLSYTKEEGSG